MKIINGKKIADRILADLKKEIKKKKLKPSLAVILVGDNPVSLLYVQKKEQAAQKIGIEIRKYNLSKQTSEKEILEIIDSLNQDSQINGILVQLPLPKNISADRIIQAIAPQKDVDGFTLKSKFDSPFILSIWQALEETKESLRDKKIIALVNSDVFGKALYRFFFEHELIRVEYITQGDKRKIKQADVLITALGWPNLINNSMIKESAILIDGGINKVGGKTVGDVDSESVKEKAKWLAPMPGGLGPMTVAFLLKNIVLAATNQGLSLKIN